MPKLLHAFSQHDKWSTLVPDVFGKTAEEFESEWRAYWAKEGVNSPKLNRSGDATLFVELQLNHIFADY